MPKTKTTAQKTENGRIRLSNHYYHYSEHEPCDCKYRGGQGRKLSVEQVRDIRKRLNKGASQTDLAREFKVSRQCIHQIKMNRTYKKVK